MSSHSAVSSRNSQSVTRRVAEASNIPARPDELLSTPRELFCHVPGNSPVTEQARGGVASLDPWLTGMAVEKAAERLRAASANGRLNVTTEVTSGSPKRTILESAEAFGGDSIVRESHSYGVGERFLLGSVSQAVALHARCSVEMARRPERRRTDTN